MNRYAISKYLQLLRKEHGYTQETLAQTLHISRQAVSKWETGDAIPDPDILLELSRLYQVTINDILEPRIPSIQINDFEELTKLPPIRLKEMLKGCDPRDVVKAAMGASPEANAYLQSVYADIDFHKEQGNIGRIRVEEIEASQSKIVEAVNSALLIDGPPNLKKPFQ